MVTINQRYTSQENKFLPTSIVRYSYSEKSAFNAWIRSNINIGSTKRPIAKRPITKRPITKLSITKPPITKRPKH